MAASDRAAEPPATTLGLTAAELSLAVAELRPHVVGAAVVDAAILRDLDDLMLWLQPADSERKLALQLVPGGQRGRVTLTRRHLHKQDFATGPLCDALQKRLHGASVHGIATLPGERIMRLDLRGADGDALAIVVELFGNRGLWLLLDRDDRIVSLSRLAQSKDRDLRPQAIWQPPAPRAAVAEPAPRFAPPVLAAIDALFTASDEAAAAAAQREACARAIARARTSTARKLVGLQQQVANADEAPRLRARADLMLAYAHTVARGASNMLVPDPEREGHTLELPLAPERPVVGQAQALYARARRLADGVATAQARLATAEEERARIDALDRRLTAASTFAEVAAVAAELVRHKLLSRAEAPGDQVAGKSRAGKPAAKTKPGEAYRRFVSAEGSEILCGKTNDQNDRLTRTARGNDVWLHIGRGYAGSHVVVRVAKGKSASLDTLLDAAAIAVHFSKARGADKAEVIYTQAKHVRKSKGAPAGAVVPHQTKTLFVRVDEARLRRLLATGAAEP